MPALADELLFVLLGVLGLVPIAFLMDVVVLCAVDQCKAVYGMLVDELVILIKDFLPVCAPAVVKGFGPFPCRQCCIPLSPSELRFTARCLWDLVFRGT